MRTLHVGLRVIDLERSLAFYTGVGYIKVESTDATITALATRGIDAEVRMSPDGSGDVRTTWIVDPHQRRDRHQ